MIIQSQDIAMAGRHKYQQSSGVRNGAFGSNAAGSPFSLPIGLVGKGGFLGTLNYHLNSSGNITGDFLAAGSKAGRSDGVGSVANSAESLRENEMKIRMETLGYLFRMFFMQSRGGLFGGSGMGMQMTLSEQTLYYQESESMEFSTQGTVVTADGRQIDFNVDVGMSRSFYEEVTQQTIGWEPALCDPLVINLDSDTANVSDQKFYFDLDCDGEEDQISMLGAGSAFLALDRNGDGVINDGSELFGTQSGNGFYDLSQYDLDGNGWIDEADDIFDKLQVWVPSEDGKGTCYKLKDKGVGAICLQSVGTEFDMKNERGEENGRIRRSGVFLMEDGRAGTIQHVDLAM